MRLQPPYMSWMVEVQSESLLPSLFDIFLFFFIWYFSSLWINSSHSLELLLAAVEWDSNFLSLSKKKCARRRVWLMRISGKSSSDSLFYCFTPPQLAFFFIFGWTLRDFSCCVIVITVVASESGTASSRFIAIARNHKWLSILMVEGFESIKAKLCCVFRFAGSLARVCLRGEVP